MREILFRGKLLDNGEWVEGFYCKHDTVKVCFATDDPKPKHLIFADDFCDCGFEPPLHGVSVDPYTVGQYIGLTDKKGKRIFEGDVVNGLLLFGMSVRAVVVFKDGAFGLEWKRGNVTEFSAFTSVCNVEYEVIGNIHDNPELLGGGEA